jgi:hypothetical protein
MSGISPRKSPLQRWRVKQLALLAVVAGALFALPSSALATATPEMVPAPEGPKTLNGEGSLILSGAMGTGSCTSWGGTAEWKNDGGKIARSGTMNLTLKGCHWIYNCTTPGQAAGTVLANSLKANLVWIDKAHTKAGVLISAPTKVGPPPFYLEETLPFAEMNCGWGSTPWTGSVIAEITSPKLGASSSEWRLGFATKSAGKQLYTQVEEAGPEHRLNWNGGELGWGGALKMPLSTATKLQGS